MHTHYYAHLQQKPTLTYLKVYEVIFLLMLKMLQVFGWDAAGLFIHSIQEFLNIELNLQLLNDHNLCSLYHHTYDQAQ
jgi:hypothetical protein